ncbi:MAG: glycosyltransferase [Gammaproteobacteria bacterium]|nr:glycosyltransferase [Gammaproteobacteria bacterium]
MLLILLSCVFRYLSMCRNGNGCLEMNKIIWILPPEKYFNSGVGKYSINIISRLEHFLPIEKVYFKGEPKSFFRYVWQFFYLPLYLFCKYRTISKIVFYDESLSYLSFFFSGKAILIVHDVRIEYKSAKSFIQKVKSKCIYAVIKKIIGCATIITPSNFTLKSIRNISSDLNFKCHVVYNSVDDIEYADELIDDNVKFNLDLIEDRVKILYVGSCEERKNLNVLFESFSHLPPLFTLIRVGPELTKDLIVQSNDIFGDRGNKSFLDLTNISEASLSYIYKKSDLLVMPSSFEGFGRPIIEAQINGLPVLSTDNTALKEVCLDSTFTITDEKDSRTLACDIQDAVNSIRIEKVIESGYKNAKRFCPSEVANSFLKAIQNE